MPNKLKQLWQQDRAAVNGWLAIPSGFSAEVMAQAGWDSVSRHAPKGVTSPGRGPRFAYTGLTRTWHSALCLCEGDGSCAPA